MQNTTQDQVYLIVNNIDAIFFRAKEAFYIFEEIGNHELVGIFGRNNLIPLVQHYAMAYATNNIVALYERYAEDDDRRRYCFHELKKHLPEKVKAECEEFVSKFESGNKTVSKLLKKPKTARNKLFSHREIVDPTPYNHDEFEMLLEFTQEYIYFIRDKLDMGRMCGTRIEEAKKPASLLSEMLCEMPYISHKRLVKLMSKCH